MTNVHMMLYSLGISANYIGFHYTLTAVELALRDPQQLLLVTKNIYPQVAKRYNTNWKAVERNIRTVISNVWKNSPEQLARLAGHPLHEKPVPAQFIAMLVYNSGSLRQENGYRITEHGQMGLIL